jgi:hypothetical protein
MTEINLFLHTPFISISTKIHVFLNGVAVENKRDNLKFSPIDFFFNEDLKWVFIGSITLIIQWVCNEFFLCSEPSDDTVMKSSTVEKVPIK